MVVRATGINPAMLRWARERAGYSVEEVASRRRVPPDRVREWEAGEAFPTWRQLERLAYKDYHRATTFFFLDNPPEEHTIAAEFRRLPSPMLDDLLPDTLYAVRQARARQIDLAELIGPQGVSEKSILRDLHGNADSDYPINLAAAVREYLNVSLEEQKGWSNIDDALAKWRTQIEDVGVWVFKRSFRQKDVAGFCLNDDMFPIIYLNNGQAKTRQIFTLFHELGHLLFDFNHLERFDDGHYLTALSNADHTVETACNQFAGEFLVPDDDFERAIRDIAHAIVSDESVEALARTYSVSREVILRKFLDRGQLNGKQYQEMVAGWRLEQVPSSGRGGNYHATQAAYLGKKYLRTAFSAFDEGRIDEFQLSAYLGVKGPSLYGLEHYAWR